MRAPVNGVGLLCAGQEERRERRGRVATRWLEARGLIGGDLATAPDSFAKPRGCLEG